MQQQCHWTLSVTPRNVSVASIFNRHFTHNRPAILSHDSILCALQRSQMKQHHHTQALYIFFSIFCFISLFFFLLFFFYSRVCSCSQSVNHMTNEDGHTWQLSCMLSVLSALRLCVTAERFNAPPWLHGHFCLSAFMWSVPAPPVQLFITLY